MNEVKLKRKYKEVTLNISTDWIKILEDDLDGVDYSKTDLIDLEKIDNDKEIPIIDKVVSDLEQLGKKFNINL